MATATRFKGSASKARQHKLVARWWVSQRYILWSFSSRKVGLLVCQRKDTTWPCLGSYDSMLLLYEVEPSLSAKMHRMIWRQTPHHETESSSYVRAKTCIQWYWNPGNPRVLRYERMGWGHPSCQCLNIYTNGASITPSGKKLHNDNRQRWSCAGAAKHRIDKNSVSGMECGLLPQVATHLANIVYPSENCHSAVLKYYPQCTWTWREDW